MKISIVTSYYNRKNLFIKTLESISRQVNADEISLEVIAVDDGSDANERLEDLQPIFPFLKIIRIEKKDKWYTNSCIPFNVGFTQAQGEIIILQNPECLHFGNIIAYTLNNIKKNTYLSFGCYSLEEEPTDNIDEYLAHPKKLEKLISENNVENTRDGSNSWYNHSVIRSCAYHFCCAILKEDLLDLGGFDPLYANGVAYDDNELLHRIKLKKMNIEIIDNEIVLHQNHYKRKSSYNNPVALNKKALHKRETLIEKNQKLFEEYTLNKKDWKVKGIPIYKVKRPIKFLFNKLLRRI